MKELTVRQILELLRKRINVIVIVTLAAAIITGVIGAVFFPTKLQYTSDALFHIRVTETDKEQQPSITTVAGDFNQIATSRAVREELARMLNIDDEKIEKQYTVKVTHVSGTRYMRLTCTGPDANTAYAIAHLTGQLLMQKATEVGDVEKIDVIDEANEPSNGVAVGLGTVELAIFAAAAVLVACVCVIVAQEMFSTRIKTAEEIEEDLGLWVMAQIPNDEREGK